jgi:outer membrane protein OmpA-like peptidoglycan-associated protein
MKTKSRTLFAVLLTITAALYIAPARAQDRAQTRSWNIKTNLLYDATATFNLGVEVRTGERTSLDIPFSYNPFQFSDNRKWKHVLVQPELRRWLGDGAFDGHFLGVHAHYSYYNTGNLPHGPFSQFMKDHRFQGWLAGVGVSWGYRWNFRNSPLAMEATVGLGYAYLDYNVYECARCGELIGPDTRHYFGPTKVGLSLVIGLGEGSRRSTATRPVLLSPPAAPAPAPAPAPVPVYVPAPAPIQQPAPAAPLPKPVKTRSASGKAYLDFVIGRAEILPDYKNNAAELRKIDATIAEILRDPRATITGITITGYASPEGSAASNQALSERRAQSLRSHIEAKHGLGDILFAINGAGEDWATLEAMISDSALPERERLLEVIRYGGDADTLERRLRSVGGGQLHRRISTEFYPRLRRSDYTIFYTVPDTDTESTF